MKMYDIIIIGAGSGGLVAAATAAGMGASTLLIENRKMGGDCLNYGCVPSKTFLKSSHLMKKIREASKYGITISDAKVSLGAVMERVKDIIKEIEPHDSKERFESLGVDVVFGNGEMHTKNSVKIGNDIYNGKKIIIATGSSAFVPPIKGLDSIEYYTNETIFDMQELPKRLIVLGAGPIGLELGQGFANLGSEVVVIDKNPTLFSKDEPEVASIMHEHLTTDGVDLRLGCSILSFDKNSDGYVVNLSKDEKEFSLVGDAVLVALGRIPNTKKLALSTVGIDTDKRGFITVNDKLQTSVPNIYAIGDVRGKFLFTHTASYEASVAIKNALITPTFKTNYYNIAWTTYTSPEVAHVGYLAQQAKDLGIYASEVKLGIDENDRAKAEDDRNGFIKVILDKNGVVIGATIVGEKAGEMIASLSLMVTQKMKISTAMSVIYQYPIQGEIIKTVALSNFKANVKPWQKSLIKKIVKR